MSLEPQPIELAVRLADEGVPLRAIARATRIPSSDLREQLLDAQALGQLLELPHDDWPAGYPRDQRALQLSRLVAEHKAVVDRVIGQIFGFTAAEVKLLLVLLQNTSLDKNRDDMSSNTVDVHVCHIRKRLQPHGIGIATLWGYGYQLSVRDRRKTTGIILRCVKNLR